MKQIGLGLKMYAGDHRERYPEKLADTGRYLAYKSQMFACPGSGNRAGDIKTVDEWTDYVYLSGLSESVPPDTILMYCPPKNHEWEFGNILFADGHVEAFESVASKGYSDKVSSFEDIIRTIGEQKKP